MAVALDTAALLERMGALLDRAAPIGRRRLVSITAEVEPGLDPAAVAFASRLASDRWFCWEHPEADFALAGLGTAHETVSRGAGRFRDTARDCAELARERLADEPQDLPAGGGPLWTGGFAFAPDGGSSSLWSSFEPALLVLPELALVRIEGRAFVTLAIVTGPQGPAGALRERLAMRLTGLRHEPLPLLDPIPGRDVAIRNAEPPEHYESAVRAATARIRRGQLDKVVLAREVIVEGPAAHDPAALHGALRELFGSCFCFCVGTPEAAFCGASPELLVRRRGAGAGTVALAGSARRSADPSVDDHLGEQLLRSEKERSEHEIVVRRIERALRGHSVWVETGAEPGLVKVANVQHMATPIHAQLAESRSAIELAGLLHPTPAVGGEPRDVALAAIDELEQLDRGWYAGPVGWIDAAEDGEFCVALRSGVLRDRTAHLYAGAGIVADSDPAAELAETEVKLAAMLPLVAG